MIDDDLELPAFLDRRKTKDTTMTGERQEPEHSPLGGSSAERWTNCPGSNVILKQLALPETDEEDYRREGLAAHEAAAYCLLNDADTWAIVGMKFHETEITNEMGDHIQVYLDYVRSLIVPGGSIMVEAAIGEDRATRPHPSFYGRVDWSQYSPDIIDVTDFKFGQGIVVEPEDNVQMLYYAYGIIHARTARNVQVRSDRIVRLSIVQPRAFHLDGPVRVWETTVGEVVHWAETILLPAMQRAEIDLTLDPGSWCRFCPAKLFCPLLEGMFGAAAKADASAIPSFGQARLSREYLKLEAAQIYIKAIKDEAYRRNMLGNTVPGTKLVRKKSDRIWKEGAETLAAEKFGGVEVMSKPEFLSPAKLEKLSPDAKKFAQEYAYHPDTGLTVALETDKKPAVKVEKSADIFAHLIEAGDNAETTEVSQ